jgi:hypothetical protein
MRGERCDGCSLVMAEGRTPAKSSFRERLGEAMDAIDPTFTRFHVAARFESR